MVLQYAKHNHLVICMPAAYSQFQWSKEALFALGFCHNYDQKALCSALLFNGKVFTKTQCTVLILECYETPSC